MENLPDEILEMIFKFLDNDSMLSAMKVSKRWRDIFALYTSLMEKFVLTIDDLPVVDIDSLPDVPVKNLVLKNFNIKNDNSVDDHEDIDDDRSNDVDHDATDDDDSNDNDDDSSDDDDYSDDYESNYYYSHYNSSFRFVPEIDHRHLIKILSKYENSIKCLEFEKVLFSHSKLFYKSIQSLSNLKHLTMNSCDIWGKIVKSPLNLKNVHSISFIQSNINLEHFYAFNELREIFFDTNSTNYNIGNFLIEVPTIKKLSVDGDMAGNIFDRERFDFRLESLDAYLIGSSFTATISRLSFLRSQLGSLKELKLGRLPYDYDGGEVLKFIIEEMKLENFFYREFPLIVNGIKQNIEEVWFNEVQISSGMEMMRQFPSIKKLRLWLCATGINQTTANQLLNPRNDLFINLNELFIQDHSGRCDLISHFIGLYKNCRNIKKLKIESSSDKLNLILQESLPFMTQLEEINLSSVKSETFQVIRNNAVDLKKLRVPLEKFDEAKEFFDANIVVEQTDD